MSNKRVNEFLRLRELDLSTYYGNQGPVMPATTKRQQQEGGAVGVSGGGLGMSGGEVGVSGREVGIPGGYVRGDINPSANDMEGVAVSIRDGHFKWSDGESSGEEVRDEDDAGDDRVEWSLQDVNISIQSVSLIHKVYSC